MSQGTASTVVESSGTEATDNLPGAAAPAWRKGFWSLVITQFQCAFNENGLKNLVIFLILGMVMQKADRDRLVLIVGTLFSVPFILFSMTGGFLADRKSGLSQDDHRDGTRSRFLQQLKRVAEEYRLI